MTPFNLSHVSRSARNFLDYYGDRPIPKARELEHPMPAAVFEEAKRV
jgi:hypothetical protein